MNASPSRHYTREQLLSEARSKGFDPSARLVTDWVSLGLLDSPKKRGLGRGKGTIATWPENQLKLFLALLDKRSEVKHVRPLCNMPVWLWLVWGDEHASLRQVRRALATWSGRDQKKTVSITGAEKIARQIVKQHTHPDAKREDRRQLREFLKLAIYYRNSDREKLLALARPVFDPHATGRLRGPAGAPVSAEIFSDLIEARATALAFLDEIPDNVFEWARGAYAESIVGYLQDFPRFASDPEFGHIHRPLDAQEAVNNACRSLLTLLGLRLKTQELSPNN